MTIRIIGTSSAKYINNFQKLFSIGDHFFWVKNESKYFLVINNKQAGMKFNSRPTLIQNIEVWEAFGLIEKDSLKFKVIVSPDLNEIIDSIKESLLIKSHIKSIQQIRSAKLLEIENLTNSISQEELNEWRIKQAKGILSPLKIEKETSKIERIISKDKNYLSRAREVLYGYINEKL